MSRLLPLCLAAALFAFAGPAPIGAQNLFAPMATVNDRVVTAFEVDQRARMLSLFNTPGDLQVLALDALIDERLQVAEARRQGIVVSEEDLLAGMEDFAGRADLSREEFVQALGENGIDVTTYEDFVRAGIAWRQLVRQQFGGQIDVAADVVARELDGPPPAELRFLLSELVLPANTPENAARAQDVATEVAQLDSFAAFSAAAQEYSAAPSQSRGGRIDWLAASELPAPLRQQLQSLAPGEVTQPLTLPNAVALFQLRAIDELPVSDAVREVEYATLALPGGRSPETLAEAARINAEIDTCDDLYAATRGMPQDRLQRFTAAPAQLPADIALEIARLDPNEVSTGLTGDDGRSLTFLMLCRRSHAQADDDATAESVRQGLVNQRVSQRAEAYLDELRANATIARP